MKPAFRILPFLLLSVFLPIILFVTIIAVLTVSICGAIRKSLLEQYHQFQVTRE